MPSISSPTLVSSVQHVVDLNWNMLSRPSKGWRSVFGLILANLLNTDMTTDNPMRRFALLNVAYVDAIHGASLILDDLVDDSVMRRGNKCVHLIYGELLKRTKYVNYRL